MGSKQRRRRRAATLLQAVADALNACQGAGIPVRLRHGSVFTDVGYVLDGGDAWVARTLAYAPFDVGDDGDTRNDNDSAPDTGGRTSVWPPPSPPTAQS